MTSAEKLHEAIRNGDVQVVFALIKSGVPPDARAQGVGAVQLAIRDRRRCLP